MPTARMTVDINWTGASGSPGANVWHMRFTNASAPGGDQDAMVEAVRDFYTAINGDFTASTTLSFNGELRGVGDDSDSLYTATPWSVTGTGSNFAPPADCAIVSWRTSAATRSGRGRTFLGPLNSAAIESNGTPTEGFRSGNQAAIDDLIETSDSFANGALGVYSRTENVFRDFVSGTMPNYFAILRSRRD